VSLEEKIMKTKILLLTILLLFSQVAFAAIVDDVTAPITRIYDLIKGIGVKKWELKI
jgi:hypothetical protein